MPSIRSANRLAPAMTRVVLAVARIVAPPLAKVLGQPVVIENKGGAEGNIGMDMVAKSLPDGYTLLFNSSAAVVNPAMYKTLAFDPLKDLQPVAVLCEYFNLIVVNASTVDAKTLPEFMELIRRNPGKYKAAAGGTRIVYEMFRRAMPSPRCWAASSIS
ncbi:MAG: tripartite tricarboxylate transporter substrate-binding protein [Casimicrobiaceae bacterium]